MGALTVRSFSFRARRRWFRANPNWLIWIAGGIGLLCLLASGWRLPSTRTSLVPSLSAIQAPAVVSQLTMPTSFAGSGSSHGAGAGGQVGVSSQPANATGFCMPTDTDCLLQAFGESLSKQIIGAVQPVVKGLLDNPVNILFQTPAADTYQNEAVITIWNALMGVATAALACLLVIGGYNAIIAPYFGLRQSSIGEFLPRLVLAYGAAHFSLDFLEQFIELENALCKVVIQSASVPTLTHTIMSFMNSASAGNLLLVLIIIVIVILLICLFGQMVVRIGMVALLIALAGPALLCLALPQTQRYGRLWLTLFSSSVLVQFFQVLALMLGGMLLTTFASTPLWNLPAGIGPALLCTGILYLVLKIPGMLNHWALGPMQAGSSGISAGDGIEAAQGYLQDQAARQASVEALATMI